MRSIQLQEKVKWLAAWIVPETLGTSITLRPDGVGVARRATDGSWGPRRRLTRIVAIAKRMRAGMA